MGMTRWARHKLAHHLSPRVKRYILSQQRRRFLAYTSLHGRPPWVPGMKPKTFSGKTQWRMMYDRRERLKILNDKLAIKGLAAEMGIATPRTLWAGTDPVELAAVSREFEGRWVLKPNHGSQVVRFFEGAITEETARETTAGWTDQDISEIYGEWHAQFARNLILAEESLVAQGTDLPDYKFFVFDGRPVAVCVGENRFSNLTLTYYRLPAWEPVDVVRRNEQPRGKFISAPPLLPEMLECAARLGTGWDFLRVDLYAVRGEVWLGELTGTPDGAQVSFDPPSFDRWLGGHWKLPPEARADATVVI